MQKAISFETYCTRPVKLSSAPRRHPVRIEPSCALDAARRDAPAPDLASVTEEARNLAREGLRGRELADRLVESHGLSRNEAYRVSLSVGDTDA